MRAFHSSAAGQLPGFGQVKTYAAYPVWKGSTTQEIKFTPISREARSQIWWHARRFETRTRQPGKANGKISRVGLCVLQALLFDFLNMRSGQCDPSYAAIAEKAGVSISSVYRALTRLRAAGVLNWVRRCSGTMQDGRFVLEQESNAYGISPASCWPGYRAPAEPPPPDPDAWGKQGWDANSAACHTPGRDGESLADAIERATRNRRAAPAAPSVIHGMVTKN